MQKRREGHFLGERNPLPVPDTSLFRPPSLSKTIDIVQVSTRVSFLVVLFVCHLGSFHKIQQSKRKKKTSVRLNSPFSHGRSSSSSLSFSLFSSSSPSPLFFFFQFNSTSFFFLRKKSVVSSDQRRLSSDWRWRRRSRNPTPVFSRHRHTHTHAHQNGWRSLGRLPSWIDIFAFLSGAPLDDDGVV